MDYLCSKHGKQSISYGNLKFGRGCRQCGNESIASKLKLSINKVRDAFESSGYQLIETKYLNNHQLLRYLCPKHGEQKISYNNLQGGAGCPKCANEATAERIRLSFETVKSLFDEYGYTLLSTEYIGAREHLDYLCPKHGKQCITYNDLQQGRRCPQCSASKGEQAIQEYLDTRSITYASEYTFADLEYKGKLRFDFCIFGNDGKTITYLIEYQGKQHYEPVDFAGRGKEWAEEQFKLNQIKDQLKIDYCKLHNIPLLTIKYSEFSLLEEILSNALAKGGE